MARTNEYEAAARAAKVSALYDAARTAGATAWQVATDDGLRTRLVALAGVREPSPTTWRALLRRMDSDERNRETAVR